MEDCEARSGTGQSAGDEGGAIVAGPEARRASRTLGDQGSVLAAVQQTRKSVKETVQQARDRIWEYRAGGLEKVKRDVTGYAREEPVTALVLAAGLGLALGWLTAGARR